MPVLTVPVPTDRTHPVEVLDRVSGPVLAVVVEDCSLNKLVVERAADLARDLAAPLRVVMIYRRAGFSTDPALLSHLERRRRRQLEQLLAASERCWPPGTPPVAVLVPAARRPWRSPAGQAWRAIERAARGCGAQRVVAPATLLPPTGAGPAAAGPGALVIDRVAAPRSEDAQRGLVAP